MKIYLAPGHPSVEVEFVTHDGGAACPTCHKLDTKEVEARLYAAGKVLGYWLHTEVPCGFFDGVNAGMDGNRA